MAKPILFVVIAAVVLIGGTVMHNYLQTGNPLKFEKGYKTKTIWTYFGVSCVLTTLLIMTTSIS
jgi:hypothetical protein